MFKKVCMLLRKRTLFCVSVIVLVMAYADMAFASPMSIDFTGELTALDVTTWSDGAGGSSPPTHYDLTTLPIGPYFVGNLTYDLDPSLAYGPNNTFNPVTFNMYLSTGDIAASRPGWAELVTFNNDGSINFSLEKAYFTNNTFLYDVLCDPALTVTLNTNTMDGNLTFYFEDMSIGTLTAQIDSFTAPSPVPEPSTIILLMIGLAGVVFFQLRRAGTIRSDRRCMP